MLIQVKVPPMMIHFMLMAALDLKRNKWDSH